MYKLSVPIAVNTLTEDSLPLYLQTVNDCGAKRVFLTLLNNVYSSESLLQQDPARIERAIRYFQDNGLETGIWIGTFGHGGALTHQAKDQAPTFTKMAGVMGEVCEAGFCPLDETFSTVFCGAVKKLAAMHPQLIMLDDDYRLNLRPYYMGCFCHLHMAEYTRRIGEEIPREQLEGLIFSGGPNKYRDAYMQLSADTLIDFAKKLRRAVDEVDDTVRLGICACYDNWDFCGTDNMAITRALAGKTPPFLRTIGAPYWGKHSEIIDVIEDTRMELAWCKNQGVELFTEGDVYPRPRYNVPAKPLELFDLALLADGSADGILKYMFDYTLPYHYETGYTERHINNAPIRAALQDMFDGKAPVGVYVHSRMHKIKDAVLPEPCEAGIANRLISAYRSDARALLSKNSIPTAYTVGEYPALVCGENARGIGRELLKNGAILDVPAAAILTKSGIDTGLVSYQPSDCGTERFESGAISGIGGKGLFSISCNEKAEIVSRLLPDNTPGAYRYENADGMRFFVLACDIKSADRQVSYLNSYYRQEQLVQAVTWLCGKALPAISLKNPSLYLLTSRNAHGTAVALENVFMDDIPTPVIQLDRPYKQIRFAGCEGKLTGDTVTLSPLAPYAFAAFEVWD